MFGLVADSGKHKASPFEVLGFEPVGLKTRPNNGVEALSLQVVFVEDRLVVLDELDILSLLISPEANSSWKMVRLAEMVAEIVEVMAMAFLHQRRVPATSRTNADTCGPFQGDSPARIHVERICLSIGRAIR